MRQSSTMYDTLLGSFANKDCFSVGFIGAFGRWTSEKKPTQMLIQNFSLVAFAMLCLKSQIKERHHTANLILACNFFVS